MKVLLDLNVILDVLLNRAPWVTDSAAIWDAHRAGEVVAHVAAFAVPTVFWVMRRQNDLRRAHEGVRICLESLETAPVARSTLQLARRQAGSDYEDYRRRPANNGPSARLLGLTGPCPDRDVWSVPPQTSRSLSPPRPPAPATWRCLLPIAVTAARRETAADQIG